MVADDTKRVIVIKNISSNLIEEAILILRNGSDVAAGDQSRNPARQKSSRGNEFILKEAEDIINQYIKENSLTVRKRDNHFPSAGRIPPIRLSTNIIINFFMISAILFLIFVISRIFRF